MDALNLPSLSGKHTDYSLENLPTPAPPTKIPSFFELLLSCMYEFTPSYNLNFEQNIQGLTSVIQNKGSSEWFWVNLVIPLK